MRRIRSSRTSLAASLIPCLSLFVLVGCAQPLGIREIDTETWFEREQRNALDSSGPSERTSQYLRRAALMDLYEEDPGPVLVELDRRLVEGRERLVAFCLSELCYLEGVRETQATPESLRLYLSAVQYAYAFLFDPKLGPPASSYDPTFRWACDFYNRSLACLVEVMGKARPLRDGPVRRPVVGGEVELARGPLELQWNPDDYEDFLVAFNYEVTGLPGSSRNYGLGVPCIAIQVVSEEEPDENDPLQSIQKSYALTVVARFLGSIVDRGESVPRVSVEIYDPLENDSIELEHRVVPLEADLTSPIAHMLGKTATVSGFAAMVNVREHADITGLFMLQAYRKDRIPVVMVHGLMSSPLTWVPLLNDLMADSELRKRYQFWFFRYPTGNPILMSATALRRSLQRVRGICDPDGSNEHFNQMVLVGHSMGGLLSKTQVLRSGDRLWSQLSEDPPEEIGLPEPIEARVREAFFFEPQPFVRRVVFMAVPHRGSTLATSWIGRFGNWLVDLPSEMRGTMSTLQRRLASRLKGTRELQLLKEKISGVSGLSPENPLLQEMATWEYDLPIHSVIGNNEVAGTAGGTDGIVPYGSAHLDAAVSELIVKSGHSVHNKPEAIIELRRILHEHLAAFEGGRKP